MAVIGIITKSNNINEIEKTLEKYSIHEKNIVIITKHTIENIKNVKFDIIIIFDQIEDGDILKKIIDSSKYLIINTDFKENMKLLNMAEDQYVITFGFNSRATITIISNENDEIILDLQREIENLDKEKIESQEIKLENNFNKNRIYEEISMIHLWENFFQYRRNQSTVFFLFFLIHLVIFCCHNFLYISFHLFFNIADFQINFLCPSH